ncbi:MAG: UTP--glucose-1-phosphate uridylyltransferase [Candidatus Parcubacteria bacterium]|nr:UTP--glucose-1-phosphate uridylyltransferase [Candidatus Parcubacteria bacterium]
MSKHIIKKAILPVAGFGTRFLPATKAQPKEMLPIVDKPVVQYIVEELVDSGIEDIIFVTGRGKRALEDHFDISYELEDTLAQKHKHELMASMRGISSMARFTYVRQKLPKGNGDALLQASHLVGDEPVLVIFGDCLYDSKVPTAKQLLLSYEKYHAPIIGLTEVEKSEVSKFGVVDGKKLPDGHLLITKFVEKPKVSEAPSNIVAPGKYIITPEIFRVLESIQKKDGELGLDDAFNLMLNRGDKIYGLMLEGKWLDTGDKLNFIKATIHMGLKHPEIGEGLRKYIQSLQK